MKGKSCSLSDIRKIKRILEQKEKLKGQYDALMRCADKSTVSRWRHSIAVLDEVAISQPVHIQPSHMIEIARHAEKPQWQRWVDKVETEKLTVVDLKNSLMAAKKTRPVEECDTCSVEDLETLIKDNRTFGTIYADPPWPYANQATRSSTAKVYKTSTTTLDDIKTLPVSQLAAANSHLHLWTTNAFLFEAKDVLEAWGFEYKSVFVWVKSSLGIGNYWRVSHEFMLLGVRGNAPFGDRSIKSWLECDRGQHSQKPDKVREFIERVSPGPRLELFARRCSQGWAAWGNEIERDIFTRGVMVV